MRSNAGINLVSFAFCIHGLIWTDGHLKSRLSLNYLMLFAAIWLFTFSTVNVACGLQLNISSFVASGNPVAAFADTSSRVNILRSVTYVAQAFMGDCILVSYMVDLFGTGGTEALCSCIGVGLSTERIGRWSSYQSLCGLQRPVRRPYIICLRDIHHHSFSVRCSRNFCRVNHGQLLCYCAFPCAVHHNRKCLDPSDKHHSHLSVQLSFPDTSPHSKQASL